MSHRLSQRPGSASDPPRGFRTSAAGPSLGSTEEEEPFVFDVNKQLHEWNPEQFHGRVMGHIWQRTDTSRMFKRGRKTGFQCLACHATADDIHARDKKIASACRPTFSVLNEYPPRDKLAVNHHWVKGAYQKSQVCDFCSKQLGYRKLGTTHRALRCAWCKRVLHEQCLRKKKDAWGTCDLGDYRSVVVGPNDILLHPATTTDLHRNRTATASGVALTAEDVQVFDAEYRHQHSHIRDSTPDLSTSPPARASFDVVAIRRTSAPVSRNTSNPTLMLASGRKDSKTDSIAAKEGQMGNYADNSDDDDDDDDDDDGNDELTKDYASAMEKLPEEKRRSFRSSFKRARRLKNRAQEIAASTVDRAAAADGMPLRFCIRAQRKNAYPLLVFVNPKSGGNQGIKLMRHFVWHLNPRQVFNIMAKDESGKVVGPKPALRIFGRVPNLRILVCGGDGTIGWVLQALDELGLSPLHIPVGTVPLGTGNDMARSLKMGGGYEGEPAAKLLTNIINSVSTQLDRWSLTIDQELNFDEEAYARESDVPLSRQLPLNVCNNYFSLGMDAWAALNFHLARERDPAKFSSRIHNKAYYGMQGAKDIFQRKYKNLHTMVRLWCDGTDYTDVIKRKSLEAIAFLNIYSYGAGTRPWGTKSAVDSFAPPRLDDGKVEVVGFSSALALARGVMHIGHAVRICQCSSATVKLLRPLAVQVDGEPCMLAPCQVMFTFKNQATMLCRPKGRFQRDLEEGRTGRCFPHQSPARLALDDDEEDEEDEEEETEASDALSASSAQYSDMYPLAASKRASAHEPFLTGDSQPSERCSPLSFFRSKSPTSNRPASAGGRKQRQQHISPKTSRHARPESPASSLRHQSPPAARAKPFSGEKGHRRGVTVRPRPTTAPASPSGVRRTQRQPPVAVSSRPAEIEDHAAKPRIARDTPVYVVPRSSQQRTGPLRYLGSHSIDPSLSLRETRTIISKSLGRPFPRKSGWRFLRYTQSEDGEGVFKVLNRRQEDELFVRDFLQQTVKNGLFICNLTTNEEAQKLFSAADTDNSRKFVEVLRENHFSVKTTDSTGFSVLHYAALNNLPSILTACIDTFGMDSNVQDLCGRSPLHYAAQMGHIEACQVLLDRGADLSLRDSGSFVPMDLAAAEGYDLAPHLRRRTAASDPVATAEPEDLAVPISPSPTRAADESYV